MTVLTWDGTGEKVYETGVDHGVLYLPNEAGVYENGVAWNGLVTVTESPTGAEANKTYADNIVYGVLTSAEEFGATIEAYTYPDEFSQFDGGVSPTPGVMVAQQARGSFGMSYRTLKGNDVQGTNFGYKIHLLYGLTAAPSEKAYSTVNDSPEMITFSWEVTSVPTNVTDLRPTSVVTVDSTEVDPDALAALEDLLYGTVGTDPSLPTPDEVIAIFQGTATASDVVVAGDVDSIDITGTTANFLFTVEAWDGDEYAVVVGGDGVNEAAAEALVLSNGIHRVTCSAAAGFYVPAAQQDVFIVNVT
jgi:hypothetical protein